MYESAIAGGGKPKELKQVVVSHKEREGGIELLGLVGFI